MTFLVPPTSAIIFLGSLYYGAMYGGAISSIMLGIPGASTAVATTFDGRPMALQGKADRALVAAATASFVGGTISVVLFTLFARRWPISRSPSDRPRSSRCCCSPSRPSSGSAATTFPRPSSRSSSG